MRAAATASTWAIIMWVGTAVGAVLRIKTKGLRAGGVSWLGWEGRDC